MENVGTDSVDTPSTNMLPIGSTVAVALVGDFSVVSSEAFTSDGSSDPLDDDEADSSEAFGIEPSSSAFNDDEVGFAAAFTEGVKDSAVGFADDDHAGLPEAFTDGASVAFGNDSDGLSAAMGND